MKIDIQKTIGSEKGTQVLNIFVGEEALAKDALVRKFLATNNLKAGDTKVLFSEKGSIIVNLSNKDKFNLRSLRTTARKIVQLAKQNNFSHIFIKAEHFLVSELSKEDVVKEVASNALLAHFDFSEFYKKKPKEGWSEVKSLTISVDAVTKSLKDALVAGVIIGEETNNARFLSNSPAGDMTPELLAKAAVIAGKRAKVSVEVFNEKKIQALGMGGIIGVGKGSEAKPRFIIMKYVGGKKSDKPIVFVGKGVTFDTGGINIKTTPGLVDMHMDMSGGASVIHAVTAISRLRLPINVIGVVPAVENMASGASYRPGDILKTYSGTTIEVMNTDAEGRIILADAISYSKTFNPSVIVDFATLTGAALVALGQRASAIFSKDDSLVEKLREAGEKSGDYVWPLPLWDEYEPDIKGMFGDVSNTGKTPYGGSINGAMFLWQFAKPNLWAHVDIAPTMTSIDGQFLSKGSTGSGVRIMIELARTWKEFKRD